MLDTNGEILTPLLFKVVTTLFRYSPTGELGTSLNASKYS
jgi:hypothetical protein